MLDIRMTKKDKFNAVIDVLKTVNDTEDLIEFVEEQIVLLDRKAEKAKETAAKKKVNDSLLEVVQEALTEELSTIAEIVKRINNPEVTAAKVSSRLNKLVASGHAIKETLIIDKIKRVAFRLNRE